MCCKYSYWFSYDNLDLWPHSSSQPVRATQNTTGHFLEAMKGIEHRAMPWVVLSSLWPTSTSASRFQKLCSQVWLLRLVYGALTMVGGEIWFQPGKWNRNTRQMLEPPPYLAGHLPTRLFNCICISDFSSPWEAKRFSEQRWSPTGLISWLMKLLSPPVSQILFNETVFSNCRPLSWCTWRWRAYAIGSLWEPV